MIQSNQERLLETCNIYTKGSSKVILHKTKHITLDLFGSQSRYIIALSLASENMLASDSATKIHQENARSSQPAFWDEISTVS